MTRIAVIGGGRIGEALIAGLLEAGHAVRDLVVAEKSEPRAKEIATDFGVLTASVADAAEGADVIVLAVKPADVEGALNQITKIEPRR